MDFFDLMLDSGSGERNESDSFQGLFLGKVKQNWEKQYPGMVMVELLGGEKGKTTTKWIPVMRPYAGKEYGQYFQPEVGDVVVVGFLSGNPDSPVVLGCLWDQNNTMPQEASVGENSVKAIVTKEGHKILFDETKDKESLKIITTGKMTIALEDQEKTITLQDEKGENKIVINGKSQEITLESQKKITLQAGGSKLILDGSANKISAESNCIEMEGKQAMSLKSQSLKAEGSVMELKANSTLKAQTSGILELKGGMAKIN